MASDGEGSRSELSKVRVNSPLATLGLEVSMCRSVLFPPIALSTVLAILAACTERPGLLAPTDSPATTSPAGLSFNSKSLQAAVVIRTNACSLFNGDGELVSVSRTISISTHSTRQNTTLICNVKNVANSTGGAVRYDSEKNPFGPGTACGILRPFPEGLVLTEAWTETLSGSGNATIRCHFKLY